MKLFPVGTSVQIDSGLPATVTGINIRERGVSYEVVWWEDRKRFNEWLFEFEVKGRAEDKTLEIGFHG